MSAPVIDLTDAPAARRARKLPVPVQVQWMAAAGVCATLEGPVHYAAGDPVLTGVQGENWTMPAANFNIAYAAVPPTVAGADGTYVKRPLVVLALLLDAPHAVPTGPQRDMLQGRAGDWLVQYGPDDFGIVAADIFSRTYELLD